MATTTLEHTVDIDAPPAAVYELWTTASGLQAWFADDAEMSVRPGGAIRLVVDGDHVMIGEFVELDPPHRVRLTFGWENGHPPAGSTDVDVRILPTDTGSRVVLRHTGLPLDTIESHAEGWSNFVGTRLVQVAAETTAT